MATNALETKLKQKINNLLGFFLPPKKVLVSLQGKEEKGEVAKFKTHSGKNFPCSFPLTKCGTCPASDHPL